MNYLLKANIEELFDQSISIINKLSKIKKSLDICFVFGASSCESNRNFFLEYTKEQTKKLHYITIENLTNDIKKFFLKEGIGRKNIELISLEHDAMKLAYAIIIFPESPGSFAELGFFANDTQIKEKIVTAKNYNYIDEKTYLNYLIDYIHKNRHISYSTMYFIDNKNNLDYIEENMNIKFPNILNSIEESYREETESQNMYENIRVAKNENIKSIAILYETIHLFPKINFFELKELYAKFLKRYEIKFDERILKLNISILIVSNYIERIDDNKFFKIKNIQNYNLIKYSCSSEEVNELKFKNILYIDSVRNAK